MSTNDEQTINPRQEDAEDEQKEEEMEEVEHEQPPLTQTINLTHDRDDAMDQPLARRPRIDPIVANTTFSHYSSPLTYVNAIIES